MPTKIVADHDMIDLGGLHISISERHGKIKAIFGQPIYETENLGNLGGRNLLRDLLCRLRSRSWRWQRL